MGRRDRERIERIRQGLEYPIARTVVKLKVRGDVIRTLEQATTEEQIDTLNQTVGRDNPNKLRDALMKKAPGEMDKGIRKFEKEGKLITVESLTAEIKSTPSFFNMIERIGLPIEWFEELAQKRIEVWQSQKKK